MMRNRCASERRYIMGSVVVVLPKGLSTATQAYPNFTVTTSAPSYTTPGGTIHHLGTAPQRKGKHAFEAEYQGTRVPT